MISPTFIVSQTAVPPGQGEAVGGERRIEKTNTSKFQKYEDKPANYSLPQKIEAIQRMSLPLWPTLREGELYCAHSGCSHQLQHQE